MTTTPARMLQRRRTAAQWTSENPVLAAGEIGIATSTTNYSIMKVGDGSTTWNNLKHLLVHTEEDLSFGVAEMTSTAAVNTANSYPRYTLPDGATTSVFIGGFNFNHYKRIDIHYAHINDHTATGNVRIRTILREVDVGTETITGGAVIHDVTQTVASAAANGGMTLQIPAASVTLTPGVFGSVYGFELQRIGADGADTLAGPMGLAAVGFNRIDP